MHQLSENMKAALRLNDGADIRIDKHNASTVAALMARGALELVTLPKQTGVFVRITEAGKSLHKWSRTAKLRSYFYETLPEASFAKAKTKKEVG